VSKARTKAIVRRKTRSTLVAFQREDRLAGLPAPYRKTKVGRKEIGEGSRAVDQ
jgi:hypothetical protein